MPSSKTLLTPEDQWNRTVSYFKLIHERRFAQKIRDFYERGPRDEKSFSAEELARVESWKTSLATGPGRIGLLWVVRSPHRLLCLGDVLLVTWTNGMNERFGMTGVSSKGARLNDYYIPLRRDFYDLVKLPGDLIDMQLDDPAIGRFVADLRASSRSRVGASIPAPHHTMPISGQVTQGLRSDGIYRSRRGTRHKRDSFFDRNWLRFFPDGKVIAGPNQGSSSWHREHFLTGPWNTSGRYTLEGDCITFSILREQEVVSTYEGKVDGMYLRLSRYCRPGWATSREVDVYKFRPWSE